MNIITKKDNTQKVFLSENTLNVREILKENYCYILDSMEREKFLLKYDECNLFKELVFENQVVGFCSYDFSREFITAALNNIYILPDFRGNGIFLDELKKTMNEHNKPSIMEPTRLIVELLVDYGFAVKINDDIVASAIEFVIPPSHVLSNCDALNEELSTHFYDLSICRSVHILDLNKAHIAYSSPLNYDIIHYQSGDVSEEYFKNIADFFKNNDVELMEAILKLEENLPIINYSLEEVIGGEGEFSFYIETLIDDAHVTRQKALKIKEQIKEEYEAGMILNESLLIRLAYLFNRNPKPTITSHSDVCSYCNMPVDSHDRYCHFCGINLDYDLISEEKNLLNTFTFDESDFSEDIRFVAYKFLQLISEKIDLEYSIFTIENTYNVYWDDLKRFLEANAYFKNEKITVKGYEFMDSHPLHFWEKFHMDIINYSDFEKYFYSHQDLNPIDICLNYLNTLKKDEFILEIISEIKRICYE